jgi:hypothetical protein
MPASSEKQRRFFGSVMAAKKGKGGVGGEARRAAKQMSKDQIKDFLKKKGAAYEAGFLRKCAEDGIDPAQLLKESARLDHVQQVLQLLFRNAPYERSLEMAKLPLLARGSEASANAASDLKALRQVLGRSKAAPDVARLPAALQEVSRRR